MVTTEKQDGKFWWEELFSRENFTGLIDDMQQHIANGITFLSVIIISLGGNFTVLFYLLAAWKNTIFIFETITNAWIVHPHFRPLWRSRYCCNSWPNSIHQMLVFFFDGFYFYSNKVESPNSGCQIYTKTWININIYLLILRWRLAHGYHIFNSILFFHSKNHPSSSYLILMSYIFNFLDNLSTFFES